MQSDVYYRFLSELVSTVETANYSYKSHKRQGTNYFHFVIEENIYEN